MCGGPKEIDFLPRDRRDDELPVPFRVPARASQVISRDINTLASKEEASCYSSEHYRSVSEFGMIGSLREKKKKWYAPTRRDRAAWLWCRL